MSRVVQVQHRGVERMLHAPLQRVEVADRGAALEGAGRADRAGAAEQGLGQAGLAGAGRTDQRERADRLDGGRRGRLGM